MLTHMALGDAYGAGLEFTSPEFVAEYNTLQSYKQHPKWKGLAPGYYTDDTQMAVALSELLLVTTIEGGLFPSDHWTHHMVAGYFVGTFSRDPREGYAQGFHQVLMGIHREGKNGPDPASLFLRRIRPHSRKNGGAMRAGPIGLLPDLQDVIDRAMFQASLTHATQEGMAAAAASACMVHYFHYDLGSQGDLALFLDDVVPLQEGTDSWTTHWEGRVFPPGFEVVKAAITALVTEQTLSKVLKCCVAFGGDVDTVAAIAMCAGSRSKYHEDDLPEILWNLLEQGDYGLPFLQDLDEQLLAKYPPVRENGDNLFD